MKNHLLLLALACFLFDCGTSPQPIDYGQVGCDFCKMTVVDQRYAAQLITSKGKMFVFDATECMINHMRMEENQRHEYSHVLVTDYTLPTTLINAQTAIYLRSPELPSPMGAYITAFSNPQKVEELKEKQEGTVYDWDALNKAFDNLPAIDHSHH